MSLPTCLSFSYLKYYLFLGVGQCSLATCEVLTWNLEVNFLDLGLSGRLCVLSWMQGSCSHLHAWQHAPLPDEPSIWPDALFLYRLCLKSVPCVHKARNLSSGLYLLSLLCIQGLILSEAGRKVHSKHNCSVVRMYSSKRFFWTGVFSH